MFESCWAHQTPIESTTSTDEAQFSVNASPQFGSLPIIYTPSASYAESLSQSAAQ